VSLTRRRASASASVRPPASSPAVTPAYMIRRDGWRAGGTGIAAGFNGDSAAGGFTFTFTVRYVRLKARAEAGPVTHGIYSSSRVSSQVPLVGTRAGPDRTGKAGLPRTRRVTTRESSCQSLSVGTRTET
jgi:hypothetical protein